MTDEMGAENKASFTAPEWAKGRFLALYELQGDYYLSCLKLPEGEQQPVGFLGQLHLWYVEQNRKAFYLNLLTSGKLNGYLSDIDKQEDN